MQAPDFGRRSSASNNNKVLLTVWHCGLLRSGNLVISVHSVEAVAIRTQRWITFGATGWYVAPMPYRFDGTGWDPITVPWLSSRTVILIVVRLLTQLEFGRKISLKISTTNFHENSYSGSRVVAWSHRDPTDGHDKANSHSSEIFCEAPNSVVACGTPHLGVWIEMCLWQENRQSVGTSKLFHFIRHAMDNLFFAYATHSISVTTYKFRTQLAT